MKALVLVLLAVGCATAPGPKRPDESQRIPVNRTVPAEVESAARPRKQDVADPRPRRRDSEVEWR
jgi:hypothetical protein